MPTAEQPVKEALTQIETERRVGYADYSEIPPEIQAKYKDVIEEMRAKGIRFDYKDPETQHFLHWRKNLSTNQMDELFGVGRSISRYWMRVCGTPHRKRIEAIGERARMLREQRPLPELKRPENAMWLALLIDTEGSMGWSEREVESGKYHYIVPFLGVEMLEDESKKTVNKAAYFIEKEARTQFPRSKGASYRVLKTWGGNAVAVLPHIRPYLDKFKRMAPLLETLFKHRTYMPRERFDKVITALFGEYIPSKRANDIILKMTEEEFKILIQKAEKLANE